MCRNLLPDQPRFPHAHHHQPAAAAQDGLDRAFETLIEPPDQLTDGARFDLKYRSACFKVHKMSVYVRDDITGGIRSLCENQVIDA
jgi:hypothetical protein